MKKFVKTFCIAAVCAVMCLTVCSCTSDKAKTPDEAETYNAYEYDYNSGEYQYGLSRVWKLVDGDYKYGFADESQNVVIPCIYDHTSNDIFLGKYIAVEKDEKWGVVDINNNPVLSPDYDSVFFEDDSAVALKNGESQKIKLAD